MEIGRDPVKGTGFHLVPTSISLVPNTVAESTDVMFGIIFRVQMNGQAMVSYNFSTFRDNNLTIKIAGCLNLPGAENLYTAEFERLMTGKEGLVVTKIVVSSNTSLRTTATIVRF